MLDSVRAQVRCELDPALLLQRGFHERVDRVQGAEGVVKEVVTYALHVRDGSPHYFAYLAPRRSDVIDPAGCLTVEVSLPKVLYGENVSLLAPGDVDRCLDEVSNRILDRVGDVGHFADFDVRGRMDLVFSYLTHHVGDYLHASKTMHLGRHVPWSIDVDGTVYWRNGQRVIRMYDKHAESGLESARNQLRFEVQLNHAKGDLLRLAGVTSTRVGDLANWEIAKTVLGFFLGGLGADLMIADDVKLLNFLVESVGGARAWRLFGFLKAEQLCGRDELIRRGAKRATFYRARADLRKLGLSEGSARAGVLAPLRLPDDYTGQPLKLD